MKTYCDDVCIKKYPNGTPLGIKPCCTTFSDADVLGHTGQFTNGAPIYCGGKGRKDNNKECYEYDYKTNQ